MGVDLDETLHLRLPRDLRAALDGAARAADSNVSPIARRALALGLDAIRSSGAVGSASLPTPPTSFEAEAA